MNIKQAWMGLDSSYLVPVSHGHQLHPEAAKAYQFMQQHAISDGVDCQLCSSYRGFDKQISIWNRKWAGDLPLYSANGELLDHKALSDVEKVHAILTWSALPGGSRHHWGTDIDVYDKHALANWPGEFNLVDSEYCEGGPCYLLAQWLTANAHLYGFARPFLTNQGGVARELWHLTFQPVAQEFEKERNPEALIAQLQTSNLAGKSTVLALFDEIYPRYVLNLGVQV
jgi:LAS superfamily LD-carboxypeptidase LdcB